jgi:hypothetical protein
VIVVPTAEPNAPTSEPAIAAKAVIISGFRDCLSVSVLPFSLAT